MNLVIEHICPDCGGKELTEHEIPTADDEAIRRAWRRGWRWGVLAAGLVGLAGWIIRILQ